MFVNGVRNIDRYVFDGCTSLETVYIGPYTESISEYAFLNQDQSVAFPVEKCLTAPAHLPDVDALLSAVKSEPMPTPEPTATPQPAQPVGDAGEPFLGEWQGVSMEMAGEAINLADLDMTMTVTLNADGTVILFDGEDTDEGVWTVSDGVAYIDGTQLTLTDDGLLRM